MTQPLPFDAVLAAVFAAAPDAVLVTDGDLAAPGPRIVFANAAFERLTGYAAEQLVGRTPRLLQGPATDPAPLARLRAACAAGEPFAGRVTNYRADGTPFEMEWHVAAVRDAAGRVSQFVSVHRDLTARAGFDQTAEVYIERLVAQITAQQACRLEMAHANRRLAEMATTDGLTGLANHRQFHEALGLAVRAHATVSLLMIDVDQFKAFNDDFGHPVGDRVLQVVADVLRSALRGADTVARYGGEEFGLVLPGLDDDHALAVADRLRAAVEAAAVPGRPVTISVGVATAEAGTVAGGLDETAAWLVDQADTALYAAKAQGRNRVRHQRHLAVRVPRAAVPVPGCDSPTHAACAGSPAGCLRCQAVPAGPSTGAGGTGGALILGAQDADADAALIAVLNELDLPVTRLGPVHVVQNVGRRLGELATLFKDRLTPYTRACVRSAFAPAGATVAEQAIAALLFAEPLSKLVEHAEHEWVRTALAEHWLFSVFHPILDVRTGQVFAQECLLRARDPADGRVIGAGPIIQACDALNLTHQLDQGARLTAIRGAAQHVPAGLKVFINFLPNTIYDPEVCLRTTMEAARLADLSLDRLVFEVVETEDIPDMARLRQILDYYRSRGVGTAVDDMGAGFTSIAYVEALRPDYVKLDRDLIVEAERSGGARQNLAEIVRASQSFGAKVIAEGMETVAQASMCVDVGVDYMQGFLFAKPAVPPQAVRVAVPTPTRAAA